MEDDAAVHVIQALFEIIQSQPCRYHVFLRSLAHAHTNMQCLKLKSKDHAEITEEVAQMSDR